MAWPVPRVSAPTAARPSRAQSSRSATSSGAWVGSRLGGGGQRLGAVRHLAALLVEFRDALAEEVEQRGDGDGARRELEQREDLGHGLDGLGDGGGLDARGRGVGERPGVEEGDPAAEHRGVVPVPGAQPPAGPGGVAVEFDQAGRGGRGPSRSAPAPGRAPERRPRVPGPGWRAGASGGRPVGRPAGDPDGLGEHLPGLAGQFRPGRGALRGPRRGPGAPGGHGLASGGEGSRADKSQPGVARGTGRHGEQSCP